jgi:hypothetical protein
MGTRTIVTSQPDVACDVCERRLLRGEQPDIFIAAGRRRTVCELCAPRAAHEGWMRERDSASAALAPIRTRRGRNFLDRLRHVGRPADASGMPAEGSVEDGQEPYDFLDGYPPAGSSDGGPAQAPAPAGFVAGVTAGEDGAGAGARASRDRAGAAEPADPSDLYLERAIEVFNASEYPRRVAGVARSLGAPEVNVRPAEELDSVVHIVVAWELCWYRYAVDFSEAPPEAQVVMQGTELRELEREEQLVNALADEHGGLALAF